MSPSSSSHPPLASLKNHVVVLTGGSNGIGAATVRLLHAAGASIVFGDLDESSATHLLSSLSSNQTSGSSTPLPIFVPTDVTSYAANLRLFKEACSRYARVDHAICIAGIGEGPTNWFSSSLSLADLEKQPPSTATLDVNLTAVCYFARIACVYLHRTQRSAGLHPSKSLTLMSSSAGFRRAPGIPIYQATKHGVLGLMRSLGMHLPATHGVRVNAVCPWMTRTGLIDKVARLWEDRELPLNEPEDVAKAVVELIAGDEQPNGRAVVVEGGRAWDVEGRLREVEEEVFGKQWVDDNMRADSLMQRRGKVSAKDILNPIRSEKL